MGFVSPQLTVCPNARINRTVAGVRARTGGDGAWEPAPDAMLWLVAGAGVAVVSW